MSRRRATGEQPLPARRRRVREQRSEELARDPERELLLELAVAFQESWCA